MPKGPHWDNTRIVNEKKKYGAFLKMGELLYGNENDWRLFNQDLYLNNAVLQKKIFAPHSTENDHTHCEFCWKKFCDSTTDLHEGYTTKDEKYWICDICYNDFKDMFHWSL